MSIWATTERTGGRGGKNPDTGMLPIHIPVPGTSNKIVREEHIQIDQGHEKSSQKRHTVHTRGHS